MKLYNTLAELLVDYRNLNNISQADFAASMGVDTRTVQRWENDISLLRSEKEIDLVKVSFLPHQLIRNLNASTPIPTYYDFKIRKYSLSNLNNDLPSFDWIKHKMDISTDHLRTIDLQEDLPHIISYTNYQYANHNIIDEQVIKQAILMLPELNLHLTDRLGFYAGHSLFLSINRETYEKLRKREITNKEIKVQDLVDYRSLDTPIFYSYNITADSNNNVMYMGGAILKFFIDKDFDDYIYCSFNNRYDAEKLDKQLGLKLVWEEKATSDEVFTDSVYHFYEGDFNEVLSKSED